MMDVRRPGQALRLSQHRYLILVNADDTILNLPRSASSLLHAHVVLVTTFEYNTAIDMFPVESQSSPRKRKPREEKRPSCTRCRSQKLRCDAYLVDFQGCSRCRKQKLKCIVPSHHINTRSPEGTSKDASEVLPNSPSSLTKAWNAEPPYTPYSPYATPSNSSLGQSSIVPRDLSNADSMNCATLVSISSTQLPTQPRIIDGFQVSGNIIDACFQQFFQHCSPLVPILSKQLSPDETFGESTLKFWVIVLIGSRRCLEDPVLLKRLSPSVINMAFMSLATPAGSPNIEALLILCTWHFGEKMSLSLSVCFVIIGSLLQAALQSGFQNCLHMVDSAGKIAIFDDSEARRRAHLWKRIVIIYQMTMVHSGHLTYNQKPAQQLCDKYSACQDNNKIGLWGKASALAARVDLSMSEITLHEEGLAQDTAIKGLIRASEAQLAEIKHELGNDPADSIMAKLHVATTLLQIRTFYLFCSLDPLEIAQLYNAAKSVLDEAAKFDTLYAPKFVYQSTTLAACIILRILKGPKAEFVNPDPGTSAYFSAINICKHMSVENNDAQGKTATILSQLWLSDRIYKHSDGSAKWSLQVRSRLSASVIFDTILWWRELFGRIQTEERPQAESLPVGLTHSFMDDSWFLDVDWIPQG